VVGVQRTSLATFFCHSEAPEPLIQCHSSCRGKTWHRREDRRDVFSFMSVYRRQCHESDLLVRKERCPDGIHIGSEIINPHGAIVKVTRTVICCSDLHLYNGYIPSMEKGDRVVVPFAIACGRCLLVKRNCGHDATTQIPMRERLKTLLGAAFAKGLTFKMGQTDVHHYLTPLLNRIQKGDIDSSFIITHRLSLEDASYG
jgi:threonine dehydrogenase-like Zn-dependent dehydrogenase